MAAISGQLDAPIVAGSRRSRQRRTLHLEAQAMSQPGGAPVVILDISNTGLLLRTQGELAAGETIALGLPGSPTISATVKWSTGEFYGCEFAAPVSDAFVSAALLRAPPSSIPSPFALEAEDDDARMQLADRPEGLSGRERVAIVAALAVTCWAVIAATVFALL